MLMVGARVRHHGVGKWGNGSFFRPRIGWSRSHLIEEMAQSRDQAVKNLTPEMKLRRRPPWRNGSSQPNESRKIYVSSDGHYVIKEPSSATFLPAKTKRELRIRESLKYFNTPVFGKAGSCKKSTSHTFHIDVRECLTTTGSGHYSSLALVHFFVASYFNAVAREPEQLIQKIPCHGEVICTKEQGYHRINSQRFAIWKVEYPDNPKIPRYVLLELIVILVLLSPDAVSNVFLRPKAIREMDGGSRIFLG